MEIKVKEEKLLQVVNLSPSEVWIENIVEVHPMKQVVIMTLVQVGMLGFMFGSFYLINLFL